MAKQIVQDSDHIRTGAKPPKADAPVHFMNALTRTLRLLTARAARYSLLTFFPLATRRALLRSLLLPARQPQHVARLTCEHLADALKGSKIDAHRFALLQSPQRRMADAGLFSQPIERPPTFFQ